MWIAYGFLNILMNGIGCKKTERLCLGNLDWATGSDRTKKPLWRWTMMEMAEIQNAINHTFQKNTNSKQSTTFTDYQIEISTYVWNMFSLIFGAVLMSQTFPDGIKKSAKKLNARELGKYTRDEIDQGLHFLKTERSKHNDKFRYPNMDAFLGILRDCVKKRAIHQPFVALPTKKAEPEIKKKYVDEIMGFLA